MKIQKLTKTGLLTLVVGAGLTGAAQAAPQLLLNGQPLVTDTAPLVQNGRVLVPMRDIFESLGATVSYNNLSREIAAQRGTTTVRMALGSSSASLNNVPVRLDVPATAYYGRTMVPLRFVSEAMGANVDYNSGTNIVAIKSNSYFASNPEPNPIPAWGNNGQTDNRPDRDRPNRPDWSDRPDRDRPNWDRTDRDRPDRDRPGRDTSTRPWRDQDNYGAPARRITIPADAVVKVRMDHELSSVTAENGQMFSATVISNNPGDSEFPSGTVLRGQVVAVDRKNGSSPGALDLRFTEAVLPDNTKVNLDGILVGLDAQNVQNVGGRVVATGKAKKNNSTAVIGIGAGAGFLLGKLLDKNELVTSILGAGAGYLYDRSQNKDKVGDAVLAEGQELGVRLRSGVTYRDNYNYSQQRGNYVQL